jgi:hypothetical protein
MLVARVSKMIARCETSCDWDWHLLETQVYVWAPVTRFQSQYCSWLFSQDGFFRDAELAPEVTA